MFLSLALEASGRQMEWAVVLNEQTNRSEEEGNERPFPYQAVTQFIVWKIKRKKKEPVFCTVVLTDVPPGSHAVLVRVGFCRRSMWVSFVRNCGLRWEGLRWWRMSQGTWITVSFNADCTRVALWAMACFSQAWLIAPSSWQAVKKVELAWVVAMEPSCARTSEVL